MSRWQTAEAKHQFTKLVEAAEAEGPQLVMRHSAPVAVVLSAEDYRRLKRQADGNFAALLLASPLESGDVDPVGAALGEGGPVEGGEPGDPGRAFG